MSSKTRSPKIRSPESIRDSLIHQILDAQQKVSCELTSTIEELEALSDTDLYNLALDWGINDPVLAPNSRREVVLRQIQNAQRKVSRQRVSLIEVLRTLSNDGIMNLANDLGIDADNV